MDGPDFPFTLRPSYSRDLALNLPRLRPSPAQVSQIEIEIQGIPQSLRPAYQTRIKASKADLTRYKKLSKDLHAQLSRAELLARPGAGGGAPSSDEPYGASSDRTRLLQGTALLEDGSRRLQDSQRIALETEEQGADILRSLRGQREQIQNARDTVSILLLSSESFVVFVLPAPLSSLLRHRCLRLRD